MTHRQCRGVQETHLVPPLRPSIGNKALLEPLRYADGLSSIKVCESAGYESGALAFQDLLGHQLATEVGEHLSRDLHRGSVGVSEDLAAPRGRLDLPRIVFQGGVSEAMLPCRHYPRLEDRTLPATDLETLEASIEVRDPLAGTRLAQVVLKPVNLELLRQATSLLDTNVKRRCRIELAKARAFGDGTS